MASDNKKISDLDNLASGDIANTDLIEVGRSSTKNFKFTWTNLKAALKTYFDTLYTAITSFNAHKTRHQDGGADEISIAGLAGEPTELTTHKADEGAGVHGSTPLATANKLAHRDAAGRMAVANASADGDVVNKGQMDTALDLKADDNEVIKKDGSVAFTGDASMGGHKLTGVEDPESDQEAATKKYVDDSLIPDFVVGSILPYGGNAAPSGYLLCDGTAVSRETYDDLFAVISTKYGVGDGSTTFNVPNLEGKVPVGLDSEIADFNDRGNTGGEKTHTLTIAEMPAHTHSTYVPGDATPHGSGDWAWSAGNTGSTGGDESHENMPPYVIVNYIIKY